MEEERPLAEIIDGKAYAARLRAKVTEAVTDLKNNHGLTPGLAVVLVGEDPASQVYVRNKAKQTVEAGMESLAYRLPDTTNQDELLKQVEALNAAASIHGILVQLPLPKQIDSHAIINTIDPAV